jgi:DNA-directed RNA polymerase subunit beta
MYAYIDRKKKFPVTTLLRAIGYQTDKDILEIFGLADEVKVSKAALKKVTGSKTCCTCFENMGGRFRR